MLSIKYSLQKDNNVRTESCQGKVSVADFVGSKIGKAMEIGFDHDEPFATFNPNRAINAQSGGLIIIDYQKFTQMSVHFHKTGTDEIQL